MDVCTLSGFTNQLIIGWHHFAAMELVVVRFLTDIGDKFGMENDLFFAWRKDVSPRMDQS